MVSSFKKGSQAQHLGTGLYHTVLLLASNQTHRCRDNDYPRSATKPFPRMGNHSRNLTPLHLFAVNCFTTNDLIIMFPYQPYQPIWSQMPSTRFPFAHPMQTARPAPIFLAQRASDLETRLPNLSIRPAAISRSQFAIHTILPNGNHIFTKIYLLANRPAQIEAAVEARRADIITTAPSYSVPVPLQSINTPRVRTVGGRTDSRATIAAEDVLAKGSLVFVKTEADIQLIKDKFGACCKLVLGDIGYAQNYNNNTIQNEMTTGSVFVFDETTAVLLATLKFNTFPVWLLVGGYSEDTRRHLGILSELRRNVREVRNGNNRATAIEVGSTEELLEVVRLGGGGAWEKMVPATFPIFASVMGREQWHSVMGNVLLSST